MMRKLLLFLLCGSAFAQVPHYVSNSGSDSNNGLTTSTPWQTLAKVKAYCPSAVPGDSVLLNQGNVWHEELDLLNKVTSASGWTTTTNPPLCSGSSSAQLTIGTYGTGAAPIIDAADAITLTCSVFSGATYACTTGSAIPSKLYADGATTETPQMLPVPNAEGAYSAGTTYYPYDAVTNAGAQQYVRGPLAPSAGVSFTVLTSWVNIANSVAFNFQQAFSTTNTGVQNVEAIPGSWYADIAGRYGTANTIYIQMSDGSNPSGHTFEGTQRPYCILMEGVNYVTVTGITCEHAQQGGVVQLTYPLDWGTYFTGEFNQFLNLNVYNFGGIVLNNEPLQGGNNLLQYGILARASMTTNPHGVRGNLISGGRVGTMDTYFGISQKDFQSAAGMQGADGGGATNNIMISNLTVATVNAGGIDYGGSNLNISGTYLINGGRVTGNIATNNAGGNIFFAGVNCGEVDSNLVFNSYGEGLQLGGGGGHTGSCEQLIQFNNVYNLSKSPSLGLFNGIDCNSFRSNASGIYIQNNHIYNVGGAAITLENTPPGSGGIGCVSTHVLNNTFSQNGLAWPALTTKNSGSLLFWDTGAGDVSPDFHNNIWIPGSNTTNEFFSTSSVNFTCSTFFRATSPIYDLGSSCSPTVSFGTMVSKGTLSTGVTPPAGPTITTTSAICVGSATAGTTPCTLAASAAVGDLLIIRSKTASTVSAFVTFSFTGTAACATLTPIVAETFQTNGAGQFTVAEVGCIVTAAGAATPVATWAGSTASFTDIEAFTVHTTNTWKTSFVDKTASNVGATTSTSCPTGTTATTTNASDFILATCDVFNNGQTQGALSGYTAFTGASRNTALVYYKSVSSTGAQSTSVPLSVSDFGVGMIAALASN